MIEIRLKEDIRKYAKEKGVYLWQCAMAMGISDATMTRKLRTELTEQEKQEMIKVIDAVEKMNKDGVEVH